MKFLRQKLYASLFSLITITIFFLSTSTPALAGPQCTAAGGTCKTLCTFPEYVNYSAADCGIGLTPFCCSLPPAASSGPWYNQNPEQFRSKVFDQSNPDEIFGERYTYAQVNWIINSLHIVVFDALTGVAPQNLLGSMPSVNTNLAQLPKYGGMGIIAGTMSQMYTTPLASGTQEISHTLSNFNPATSAHAQGYGFNNTASIRPLWSASRNMAYLLTIVLLVAAGFMVMFRVKINPQTAVSLQLMIPKLILTLILVTFSYAIAGLVIDLVYVLVGFTISLLSTSTSGIIGDLPRAISYFGTPGFSKLLGYFMLIWAYITFNTAAQTLGIGAIFGLLIGIVIFVLLLKVWWTMLKAYLTLLILIVIGPWQIMLGLLPGQNGFSSWLRNVIAQASVFVVIPLMFMIALIFSGVPTVSNNIAQAFLTWLSNTISQAATGVIVQPINNASFPSFPLFGNQASLFSMFLSLGILALMPKMADMIRDALKIPPFKYGTAFGESLGPLGWATGRVGSSMQNQLEIDTNIAKGMTATQASKLSAQSQGLEVIKGLQKRLGG